MPLALVAPRYMPPSAPQQPLCSDGYASSMVAAGLLGGVAERGQGRVAVGEAADVGHEGGRRGRARAAPSRRACSVSASQSGTVG